MDNKKVNDPRVDLTATRGADGKLIHRYMLVNSDPTCASLLNSDAPLPDLPAGSPVEINGRNGRVLTADNGTHTVQFDNGDLTLASSRDLGLTVRASAQTKLDSIAGLAEQLSALDPLRATRIAGLSRQLNYGGYGNIRDGAWHSILSIDSYEADVASEQGRDGGEMEEVNVVRARAESVYDDYDGKAAGSGGDYDTVYAAHDRAKASFRDAAVAVAYRDYIGDVRFPGFTQEAYDHLTRPVRQVLGAVHPSDEPEPASWSKRHGCVTHADHVMLADDDGGATCVECGEDFPNVGV